MVFTCLQRSTGNHWGAWGQHPLILITPEPKKKILVNSGTAVVTPALDQDHPPGTSMVPKLQGLAHGKGNGQIIVSLKAGICEVRANLLRWSLSVYLRDKSSFWSCCSLKADPGWFLGFEPSLAYTVRIIWDPGEGVRSGPGVQLGGRALAQHPVGPGVSWGGAVQMFPSLFPQSESDNCLMKIRKNSLQLSKTNKQFC